MEIHHRVHQPQGEPARDKWRVEIQSCGEKLKRVTGAWIFNHVVAQLKDLNPTKPEESESGYNSTLLLKETLAAGENLERSH
ncbi:hypothetical protein YC2023_079062 [Brassica napus]